MIEIENRKKRVEVVERERQVVSKRFCDLCGDKCLSPERGDWAVSRRHHEEDVTVCYRKSGAYYNSEEDCRRFVMWDICPECWDKKLTPFLVSQAKSKNEKEEYYVEDSTHLLPEGRL